MARNFRIYRSGGDRTAAATFAVGTERDDGTAQVIFGGAAREAPSVAAVVASLETLSSGDVELIYDDEATP